IELERSILGFDGSHQSTPLPDVTIVLLSPNSDGTPPRVMARGVEIPYGTMITSLDDKEQARERFGLPAKAFMLGADKIEFETIGGVTMTLNENRAVYFDVYDGPAYRMNMDNGFYHIRMTWFDQLGRIANYNHPELLAPQIYVDAPPPIDIRFDDEFLFPVYKEGIINASDIFTDLSGTLNYYWDTNNDGLPEATGESFTIGPQNEPKELEITVIASVDLVDEGFEEYKKTIKVVIYPPKIVLEKPPLKDNAEVEGLMEPLEPNHDLTDMPFSVFRKRWGVWKNLGLLKQKTGPPSDPPLSDKNNYQDNYYATSGGGDYSITGFTSGPSNVLVGDGVQHDVARVHWGTGQIELLDLEYELLALPASREFPTRVSVVKKGFDTALSNIYYVSDEDTDVEILEAPLTQSNIGRIGVTIGDRNPNDVIIAHNMPGYAESYPGGAAIFNDQTQINVALINADGAIRMMQSGYSLRIKNEGQLSEKVIFEIIDRSGQPVFDVFIAAEFENLNIRQEEIWNELKATIGYLKQSVGYLKQSVQPIFASLFAQSKPKIPKQSAASESPFEDLDSSHPYYQQILDLYKRRIVTGYEDGGFKPDAKLTRAEFVKIALGSTKCFDCTRPTDAQRAKHQGASPFPDVRNTLAWYYYCVAIAKELGMITGYGDGYFKPGRNISRAESVAVLLRQSEIEISEAPEEYFQDVPDDAWYVDYVYTAVETGLIRDNAGFVFPDEEITRGEFAFMASGVIELQDCRLIDSDGDGIPDWWEMENNLDPLFAGDALYDADDDFCTALEEFQAGSDPNDPASACRVECLCLDNPNQNDTDKDGTIDPCDEDLDDDGVTNTLCMFDENGLVDPELAAPSEDNCIFTENPDQLDYNQDNVGDICLPLDQCPEVPEDLDGYHDLDGCPEVFDETADNPPGVYVNKGPACYFLDWEKDIVKGDVIMTAITDVITHDVIYSESNKVSY
ncbi:S-layer homology domain-containing protein, partial [Candidatus Pacearchaeota archaeon]|nr:S-layer homology domain-containing protein [Candidatus Pacearchaeota archaeon]